MSCPLVTSMAALIVGLLVAGLNLLASAKPFYGEGKLTMKNTVPQDFEVLDQDFMVEEKASIADEDNFYALADEFLWEVTDPTDRENSLENENGEYLMPAIRVRRRSAEAVPGKDRTALEGSGDGWHQSSEEEGSGEASEVFETSSLSEETTYQVHPDAATPVKLLVTGKEGKRLGHRLASKEQTQQRPTSRDRTDERIGSGKGIDEPPGPRKGTDEPPGSRKGTKQRRREEIEQRPASREEDSLVLKKSHAQNVEPKSSAVNADWLSHEFCRSKFACWFQIWAVICCMVIMLLLVRGLVHNCVSGVQWCCRLPKRKRLSPTMRGISKINYGMDKKSWSTKSPCSEQIRSEIEVRLRELFSRCDVTLEMVGSLSGRLGKSLSARPEAEDSLQEYRFTRPVLGTDADFMVILQVPVAPDAAEEDVPYHMLRGQLNPYMTLSDSRFLSALMWHHIGGTHRAGRHGRETIQLQQMPRRRLHSQCSALGFPPAEEGDDDVFDVARAADSLPGAGVAGPGRDTAGTDAGLRSEEPVDGAGSGRSEEPADCTGSGRSEDPVAGANVVRGQPEGAPRKILSIRRTSSLTEVVPLAYPMLATPADDSTPPGFTRVSLFTERVLAEHRVWWREEMSEPGEDGAFYLSSKKARELMKTMFDRLELDLEQDRRSMSIIDACMADYRGQPRYEKEVTVRGPAVTLRLTQTDDRAFREMPCMQNNWCHWILLCCSVILLIPFFVWIFFTGGSWPAQKCMGGACCSIYYSITLLVPMLVTLPMVLLLRLLPDVQIQPDTVYIVAMVVYVAFSAFLAAVFVCVSQCFFKLPTIFYGDFVTALVHPVWPRDARSFVTRRRKWPSRHEIDYIVRQGCHLVPKPPSPCRCMDIRGVARCQEAHLLWRYSFSQAEVRLSMSIPEHYRRAHVALKWIVKKYVMKGDEGGSNMRSFYIKTCLFWELEENGEVPETDGVEERLLHKLALRLYDAIKLRRLDHFFIPGINLLSELTDHDFQTVEAVLNRVLDDPAPLINLAHLNRTFYTIGLCEAIFCTPGKDFRNELCCIYATRLPYVW